MYALSVAHHVRARVLTDLSEGTLLEQALARGGDGGGRARQQLLAVHLTGRSHLRRELLTCEASRAASRISRFDTCLLPFALALIRHCVRTGHGRQEPGVSSVPVYTWDSARS
jgi:hypothetical protein